MVFDATDARLKDAILEALRDDVRVNEAAIGVAVEQGVVTLTGYVQSEAEKAAAQETAHRTPGVLDVANDICVKAPFALGRSDTDLAADVRRALEQRLPAAAARIHSTVYDACVTLLGTVETARDREDAERVVRRVGSVRRVDNRIAVRPAAGAAAPAK
jgi:osmotically-inducible protein OsmY